MSAPSTEELDVRGYYRQRYANTQPTQQEWTSATAAPELVKLVMNGAIPAGARVLEVGCGVGSESVYLAVQGFQVSGIDISEHAIERARTLAGVYGAEVDWAVGDVLDLPYEEDSFDVVVDRGCFHCLRDHERAKFASEIARVIRSRGLYVLRCLASQRYGHPNPEPTNQFVRWFGVSSHQLWATFSPHFACEKLELAAPPGDPETVHFGWLGLWRRFDRA